MQILDSIKAAKVFEEPFESFFFRDVFSKSFYGKMIELLPADSLYREMYHPDAILPDGKSSRKVFELNEATLATLAGPARVVWEEVFQVVSSEPFRNTVFSKLGVDRDGYPRCALVRDAEGFKIRSHPDHASKVVTVQFYLPSRGDAAGLGTTFYEGPERPFMTLPFFPNCGYAFRVSQRSWHAREKLPVLKEPRNTLSVTFYKEPGMGDFAYWDGVNE